MTRTLADYRPQHDDDCKWLGPYATGARPDANQEPCSCGLDALLAVPSQQGEVAQQGHDLLKGSEPASPPSLAVPSSSQQEIAAVKKEENDDQVGHVPHGGRSDLEPAARPELSHAGSSTTEPRLILGEVLAAANNADWLQVVLNGGPPCFHFDRERQRFCLAAQRWAGHGKFHPFTGLADVIGQVVYDANLSVIEAGSAATAVGYHGTQVATEPASSAQSDSAQVIDSQRDPLSGDD